METDLPVSDAPMKSPVTPRGNIAGGAVLLQECDVALRGVRYRQIEGTAVRDEEFDLDG